MVAGSRKPWEVFRRACANHLGSVRYLSSVDAGDADRAGNWAPEALLFADACDASSIAAALVSAIAHEKGGKAAKPGNRASLPMRIS